MAINVSFAGMTILKPGGSGMVFVKPKGYDEHDMIGYVMELEDRHTIFGMLGALVSARIIKDWKINQDVFYINTKVTDE